MLKVFLPKDEELTPMEVFRLIYFPTLNDEFEDFSLNETFKLLRKYRHSLSGLGYYNMDESNPIYVEFNLKPLEINSFTTDIKHLNQVGATY